jgi:hypothetical protein
MSYVIGDDLVSGGAKLFVIHARTGEIAASTDISTMCMNATLCEVAVAPEGIIYVVDKTD